MVGFKDVFVYIMKGIVYGIVFDGLSVVFVFMCDKLGF